MRRYLILLFIFGILDCAQAVAQPLIAETPALTPAEEKAKFHVPPGFEVQLVAQEPEIHKPTNMKFDDRGRLWVSSTIEYPFPAIDEKKARDQIVILSDFGPDGKAQKAEPFAKHLNIPIGVVPMGDKSAIAWSIPNIYRFTDTNGDGVADQKTLLYGPFGVVDTHGDQNAFTRWLDGWIYANHGFSNDSHIKDRGKGPVALHMQSGNTYRFRPDGSHAEQFSWGQVNPFGLSFDALGNLFSADCHSRAVTMLLREGYYQSFGKPPDGLGFAPDTTNLDHGGTGIAGVAYSSLPNFPRDYRDVLFVGNVITNRVHCDPVEWNGSSPTVKSVGNFLTSDDPWFRPVDIQQGPDGALYVADFYNCIIGHYEVPLTHPKRDRTRGRIWRIVYKGKPDDPRGEEHPAPMPDLRILDAPALFAELKHPNLAVRVLATNLLIDKFPKESAQMASDLLSGEFQPTKTHVNHAAFGQPSHAIWILERTTGISEPIARKIMHDGQPGDVQVQMVKALGETASWQPWQFELVQGALRNDDPFVRRAAAEALSKHPAVENLLPLLSSLNTTPHTDVQLYHGTRIALRDQLRNAQVVAALVTMKLKPEQRKQLVEFAATAPSGPAALLVFDEALRGGISNKLLIKALPAGARYIDSARIDPMVANIQKRFPHNPSQQIELLRALADGISERGLPETAHLRNALTEQIRLALSDTSGTEWFNTPLPGKQFTPSPWGPQQRNYSDGDITTLAMSSLAEGGERLGGVLHSPTFEIPAQLSFWMCGHDGVPNQPALKRNYIRLVLDDGTEVARTYPPRTDTAQRFTWYLQPYAGKRGHVEVVDGITDLDGFAWLAVARFDPAVITLPDHPVGEEGSERADLLRLAGQLKLTGLMNEIVTTAGAKDKNLIMRLAATDSLLMLDPARAIAPLTAILSDATLPISARQQAAQQLARIDRPDARTALLSQLKSAPESVAILIAAGVASHRDAAAKLLDEIRAGRASATLLREPNVIDGLKASGLANIDKQIADLTSKLSPKDNRIEKLIAERRAGFLAGKFDPEVGKAVFAKSVCANCHRIGEVGKTLGPTLDGIGNRGLDRLLEDTLDPSRNVDVAFRTVTIETEGGQLLSGFGLREEGHTLFFNDANGKQLSIPLAEVVERTQSSLSPMPANVIEQMPEQDYYSLLAYLLSLKGK